MVLPLVKTQRTNPMSLFSPLRKWEIHPNDPHLTSPWSGGGIQASLGPLTVQLRVPFFMPAGRAEDLWQTVIPNSGKDRRDLRGR